MFDIFGSLFLLAVLSPFFLIIALLIKLDSKGEVFFRQTRVTHYGREFRILKFRTMVSNAEELGSQITGDNDTRVTRVGSKLRACRLDEIPQLINILLGDMTFVGTRPEVPRFVAAYTDEMYATLLMPAGLTNEACIMYKDEAKILADSQDIDKAYIELVLPKKMEIDLQSFATFSLATDFKILAKTLFAVIR